MDRELDTTEKMIFIEGLDSEFALNTIATCGGKPSLYDVAFIELYGILQGQRKIIVELGRQLEIMRYDIKEMKKRGD